MVNVEGQRQRINNKEAQDLDKPNRVLLERPKAR
jgi:hypothetical protein